MADARTAPADPPTGTGTGLGSGSPRRRSRDRRGRGMRGPGVLPQVPGQPATPTRGERFDALVIGLVTELEERWHDRLGLVEYAVEDTPQLPDDWAADRHGEAAGVPLSSLVPATADRPARLVLFRRPIEHRCEGRDELEALVLTVLVEQVAELLGLDADEVDPRYRPED